MTAAETFQIPLEIAEAYEERFVPAIFRRWAPHTLAAVAAGPGDRLVDVACGTGIVARTAIERGLSPSSIVGVDLNEAMLTVARRVEPRIDWRQGDAAAIPVADGEGDAAVCQMAMMFMPDPSAVLAELGRVAGPDGRIGVVVPASLDAQPAYGAFVDAAVRHAGDDARPLVSAYWRCGERADLDAWCRDAGLEVVDLSTPTEPALFSDAADFVATEIDATPLAERLVPAQRAAITADVADALSWIPETEEGFAVPLACHVVAARRSS